MRSTSLVSFLPTSTFSLCTLSGCPSCRRQSSLFRSCPSLSVGLSNTYRRIRSSGLTSVPPLQGCTPPFWLCFLRCRRYNAIRCLLPSLSLSSVCLGCRTRSLYFCPCQTRSLFPLRFRWRRRYIRTSRPRL